MRKLFFCALALLVTQAAFAQDGDGFGGVYIAADIGFINPDSPDEPIFYGASLGYRSQINDKLVLGVEGSYGRFNFDRFSETVGERISSNEDLFSVAGTAGYAFGENENSLFSVGLGYAGASGSGPFAPVEDGVLALAQFEWLGQNGLGVRLRATTIEFGDTWTYTGGLVFRF